MRTKSIFKYCKSSIYMIYMIFCNYKAKSPTPSQRYFIVFTVKPLKTINRVNTVKAIEINPFSLLQAFQPKI